jgi:hypothetical protein
MRIIFEREDTTLVARVLDVTSLNGCPEEIRLAMACPTEWAARLLEATLDDGQDAAERKLGTAAYELGFADGRARRKHANPYAVTVVPSGYRTLKSTARRK